MSQPTRRLSPGATMVGVNGDYSTPEGVPSGVLVQSGTLKGLHDLRRDPVVEVNTELTEALNSSGN